MEVSGDDKGDRALYRQEVQKGINLFEAGFKGLQQSKFDEQKQQYEKSMRECLQVIQDAATGLANQKLIQMKDQLSQDYQKYVSNPSSDNQSQVQKDIDQLKKSSNA